MANPASAPQKFKGPQPAIEPTINPLSEAFTLQTSDADMQALLDKQHAEENARRSITNGAGVHAAEPAVIPAAEVKVEPVAKEEKPKVEEKAKPEDGTIAIPDSILNLNADPKTTAASTETAAAATETKDDLDTITLPATASKASSAAFSDLKAKAKEAKAEAAKTKAEFEAAKAEWAKKTTPTGPAADSELTRAELEAARKQIAEYEGELKQVKVQATREYKESIEKPLYAVRQSAQELCARNDIKTTDLQSAFDEPDKAKRNAALSEMVAGMNEFDRDEVKQILHDYQSVMTKKTAIDKDAGLALEAINARRQQQFDGERKLQEEAMSAQQQQIEAGWRDGMEKGLKSFTDQIPFLRKVEGDSEWNKAVDDFSDTARKMDYKQLTSLPVDTQTQLVTGGLALPHVFRVAQSLQARVQSLEKELGKYRNTSPRAAGHSAENGKVDAVNPLETMDQRIDRQMGSPSFRLPVGAAR